MRYKLTELEHGLDSENVEASIVISFNLKTDCQEGGKKVEVFPMTFFSSTVIQQQMVWFFP